VITLVVILLSVSLVPSALWMLGPRLGRPWTLAPRTSHESESEVHQAVVVASIAPLLGVHVWNLPNLDDFTT